MFLINPSVKPNGLPAPFSREPKYVNQGKIFLGYFSLAFLLLHKRRYGIDEINYLLACFFHRFFG